MRRNLVHSSIGYDLPAEYQWTLQGGFKINDIIRHVIASSLQICTLIFLSLSHYVVAAVYEWFISYIFPYCHHRYVDDTDAFKGTQNCSGRNHNHRNQTYLSPVLNEMSTSRLRSVVETIISGKPGGPYLAAIYHQCTWPASFVYFNSGIPSRLPCKKQNALVLSLAEILLQKLLAPYTMAL